MRGRSTRWACRSGSAPGTAPLFETASATYDWLNRVLAVGIGRRTPGQVSYTVYAIA